MSSIFAAPFRSSQMRVEEAWIDDNAHMNVAYYVLVFDRAIDEVCEELGIDAAYKIERKASIFTAELHVNYLKELVLGAPLFVTWQCLAADEKRMRSYLELFHAEEGYLAASSEQLHIHVDLQARRASPFPPEVRARLDGAVKAHAALPWPKRAGAAIDLKKR
ncbi:thioesterase family protein [Afifella sp. IM 167]|uniref:thioesterase family protein n=1 Tax=Afifella sp. IM 167 TaxID=2033586 RepID=UPI001CCBB5B8|nr:thioesterase family protein [Afifella sp. IM 167]MBZ8135217.1 thioesterase [Afifella sp. IM 167]